jgi:hypothetical protein
MLRPFSVAVVSVGLLLGLTGTAHARSGARSAEEVQALPVVLTAELSGVELFGEAVVSGRLDPPHPGASVEIAFQRDGSVVERRNAQMGGDGTFRATFEVTKWGTFRAEVTWPGDTDHDPATTTTNAMKVDRPRPVHEGSKGRWVGILEERLDELGYYFRGVNRRFDQKTGDAVLAFHKVNGMPRSRAAGKRTWKRLTDPRTPKPRAKKPKTHIEIDQSKQVLYVVREGEIDEILHTSTGAGGATRDGVFHVHRKIAGYSPGRLYYPSYFDGNRAVHGWPDVPPTNASHGCSRVPMWSAKHMHAIMHYGMEVRVYH